ncbi:MAG: ankyrin repeat domain-containing protein [Bryobacteraceae bacterium]
MGRTAKRRRWTAWILVFGGLLAIGWLGDILGESWLAGNMHLYEAIDRGDVEAVRSLLGQGKDPNSRFNGIRETDMILQSETPLLHALSRGHEAIAVLLLERGADARAESARHDPALHVAVSQGMTDAVRVLLAMGADPNRVSRRDGGTPLWLRAGGDRVARTMTPEIRTLLVNAGAK